MPSPPRCHRPRARRRRPHRRRASPRLERPGSDEPRVVGRRRGHGADELLAQVKSGQGISDLLGRAGQLGYGSTVGDSVRGGIVLDLYA